MCVCVFQGCCSEAEAQQAGRMQTISQPIQCELPTIPVQIGSHFLKGVSFNESAAENLKLKTVQCPSVSVSGSSSCTVQSDCSCASLTPRIAQNLNTAIKSR